FRRIRRGTLAGVPGLEPRTKVPETSVLPITPYPNGSDRNRHRETTLPYMAERYGQGAGVCGVGARDDRARTRSGDRRSGRAQRAWAVGTPMRSRLIVAATRPPEPAATMSCCGPGEVMSPAA